MVFYLAKKGKLLAPPHYSRPPQPALACGISCEDKNKNGPLSWPVDFLRPPRWEPGSRN
jgi:hypothetical protein